MRDIVDICKHSWKKQNGKEKISACLPRLVVLTELFLLVASTLSLVAPTSPHKRTSGPAGEGEAGLRNMRE